MPADHRTEAEESRADEDLDQLVHRSRLLGAGSGIVNYGGGNTSVKTRGFDHAGRPVEILWIKGSGSNLGTITRADFTPLNLADLRLLRRRQQMSDEEMVEYLGRCSLQPESPRPSIETLLHAFLPFSHVDHTHAEAALALCCMSEGQTVTRQLFGDQLIWVPYVRPGFALAKLSVEALDANPGARGMLLAKHGLVTWGETSDTSYRATREILQQAEQFLEDRVDPRTMFGGRIVEPPPEEDARRIMIDVLPVLRGLLAKRLASTPTEDPAAVRPVNRMILHWDRSPEVMDFVCSRNARELAETGAACPDHVMYTRFGPLVLDWEACARTITKGDDAPLEEAVSGGLERYAELYQSFFEENREGEVQVLDTAPRIVLFPGLGVVAAGRDAWTAANAASLYRSAIRVMRWASSSGEYVSLTPEEAWAVEYWPLERRKLAVRPPPGELEGHIAVVTGGAGAIGRATARRLLSEDCHVVITDVDADRLEDSRRALQDEFGPRIIAMRADAASEADNERTLEEAVLTFGGIDILVPNAGLAAAAPIEETTVDEWERIQGVLVRGYFLACRAAFRVMKRQALGGSIVLNASKSGLAGVKNALAYATAKAAETHMARCLAEEGGPHGIRVNAVAPDAVIQGSGLWSREWREERARAYGFRVEDLEEYYRQRNALKVRITAEDVAEAILFLVSRRSAKTTGSVLPVDGGVAAAYPR